MLLFKCMQLPIILYFIVSIGLYIFRNEVSLLLFEEVNLKIINVLIVTLFFFLLNRFFTLSMQMEERSLQYSLMQFATKFFDLVFFLILYYFIGSQYEILIYSQSIAIFSVAILGFILTKNIWKAFWINRFNKLNSNFNEIITYSYPLLISSLIYWISQSIDRIALKELSTFYELGVYSAAFKIVTLLYIVSTSIRVVWTSVKFKRYEANPNDRAYYEKAFQYVFILMYLFIVLFIILKELVIFILGEEFSEGVKVLPFLAIIPLLDVISEITSLGINFAKKTKWNIYIFSVSAIFNIVGNLYLVPILGAKGAAISTCISYIIFFALRTHVSLKYFKVNYHLKKTYLFIILIFLYSTYSTFCTWNIWDLFFGIVLFLLFLWNNLRFIKMNLKELLLSYAKKG